MKTEREKIVVIDEAGFAHICSSILRNEGYWAEACLREEARESGLGGKEVALVITSYPYGKTMMDRLKGLALPVIVLTDHIGKEIICMLEELEQSYCLVKPIDYAKLTLLVKGLMTGVMPNNGGYDIV